MLLKKAFAAEKKQDQFNEAHDSGLMFWKDTVFLFSHAVAFSLQTCIKRSLNNAT